MKTFWVSLFTVMLGIGFFMVDISIVSAQETIKEEFTLEQITVTAERREQSLQDVPISATVFTSENIEEKGINNVIDLQQFTPSVAINTYNRSTFINIRGVGIAQSAPTSNPGVAFYIDGVYVPHEQWISHSFYDINSIEVLRGPQGTLTGQNSTGGAIYVTTPPPNFVGLSGYIDQTIADYEWYRTIGAVNVPILRDKLAIRAAATYNTQDSFTDNIGPSPSNPGSKELASVRAGIRFKPTEAMTFDFRYEYFNYESDYNAVKNRNDMVTSDPFIIEEDAISFLNQDGYRASIEGRIDITDSMQFRALVSEFEADNEDQADGDRTATALPVPEGLPASSANRRIYPGRVSLTTQALHTMVAEVNLISTGEGPFQWVAGAFYLDENTPTTVDRDNYHTVNYISPTPGGSIDSEAENDSWSIFGQVDYRFLESFEVDLGLRYSEDGQDYTRYEVPGPPPPPGVLPYTTSINTSETTGRFGLKYFMNPETMFYATASKGYKAGGVNLAIGSGFFQPETNKVYEAGVKTTIADGRLRIDGDVFYSDYSDIQLSATVPVNGVPTPNTQNASSGEIYGAELELLGQFNALGFNLGLSLINGEFSKDAIITNSVSGRDELVTSGTDLPFSPDVTLTAGIHYDFWIKKILIAPRLQLSYIGEQFATPFPGPETTVPDRTVIDLRVMFQPIDNLTLEAFATNLFDEEYIAVQLQNASSADGGLIYGAPRQIGIQAKYKF